jgi:hypothetical protein
MFMHRFSVAIPTYFPAHSFFPAGDIGFSLGGLTGKKQSVVCPIIIKYGNQRTWANVHHIVCRCRYRNRRPRSILALSDAVCKAQYEEDAYHVPLPSRRVHVESAGVQRARWDGVSADAGREHVLCGVARGAVGWWERKAGVFIRVYGVRVGDVIGRS